MFKTNPLNRLLVAVLAISLLAPWAGAFTPQDIAGGASAFQ